MPVNVSGYRSVSATFATASTAANYGTAAFADLTLQRPLAGPYALSFLVSCPGGAASAAASANCASLQATMARDGGLGATSTLTIQPGRAVSAPPTKCMLLEIFWGDCAPLLPPVSPLHF